MALANLDSVADVLYRHWQTDESAVATIVLLEADMIFTSARMGAWAHWTARLIADKWLLEPRDPRPNEETDEDGAPSNAPWLGKADKDG